MESLAQKLLLDVLDEVNPPRLPELESINPEVMWATCTDWINSNIRLVYKIIQPHQKFLPLDQADILDMAYLAAYESLSIVIKQGQLEDFIKTFVSYLTEHSRAIAKGPLTVNSSIHNLSLRDECPYLPGTAWPQKINEDVFWREAAPFMTSGQQYAWELYLFSCRGLSMKELLKKLNLSRRETYRTLERGIERVLRAKQGRSI